MAPQPGGQSQSAPSLPQGQVRTGIGDRSIQNDPRNVQNRILGAEQGTLRERTAFPPQAIRGPDLGFWFNRASRDGLVIADVATTGAIATLGFREGDRIATVNGRRVVSEPDFINFLLAANVNRVEVVVFRDGRNQTIVVDPTLLTEQNIYAQVEPLEQFGIVLDDRFDDRVVVWRVVPRSPAFYAGFRPGDVVTTLSGQPFRTRTEFEKAVVGLRSGEANVQIRRGDRTRDLLVDVPQFERTAQRSGQLEARGVDRVQAPGSPQSQPGSAPGVEQRDNGPRSDLQPNIREAAPNLKDGVGGRSEVDKL